MSLMSGEAIQKHNLPPTIGLRVQNAYGARNAGDRLAAASS